MKIICIDTSIPGRLEEKYIHITIGRIYDAIDFTESDQMCEIKDDSGKICWYLKSNFKKLSEIREEKLEIILED